MISRLVILYITLFLLLSSAGKSYALGSLQSDIDSIINNSKLNSTSIISVSIRDLNTGKSVYQRYSNLSLRPASTLKTFTVPVILNSLGSDFKINTNIYYYKKNIYIKLSGDPFLKSKDLDKIIKKLKKKGINKIKGSIVIDDSVFDKAPYGVGWMWDDDNSPYVPKYSPYNLDHNTITVNVRVNKGKIFTKLIPNYNLQLINNAVISDKNALNVEKKTYLDLNSLYISGFIKDSQNIKIPVYSPESYFKYRLRELLKANSIKFNKDIKTGSIPPKAKLIAQATNDLKEELLFITHYSDNMAIESLLKLASAKYYKNQGTTDLGLKLFKDFYNNLGLSLSSIKIVDASGVSFYNLFCTDWMSYALFKIYSLDKAHADLLPSPGDYGTLKNRLKNINAKIKAKTGTLSGISRIVGYINTPKNSYCFAILIQNYTGSSQEAKSLENSLIKVISNY